MAWKVEFATPALRELDKLDRQVARRIVAFLHDRVVARGEPRSVGQALKGPELSELWKYRIGDHRLIAAIEDSVLRVLVVRVGNRAGDTPSVAGCQPAGSLSCNVDDSLTASSPRQAWRARHHGCRPRPQA